MRSTALMFCAFLLITCQAVYPQSREGSAQESQDKRWGLAAALFNQGSGEVAVSKKLSKRTMVLISAEIGWSHSSLESSEDEAGGGLSTSQSSTRSFSITVGPEWRRYSYRTPRLALYGGIQPQVGYSWREAERAGSGSGVAETTFQTTSRATSIGMSLALGAEYEVLTDLSLSVHFLPLRAFFFRHRQGSTTRDEQRLTFSQDTALFVRIYF